MRSIYNRFHRLDRDIDKPEFALVRLFIIYVMRDFGFILPPRSPEEAAAPQRCANLNSIVDPPERLAAFMDLGITLHFETR